jgi:hypothetical protein
MEEEAILRSCKFFSYFNNCPFFMETQSSIQQKCIELCPGSSEPQEDKIF